MEEARLRPGLRALTGRLTGATLIPVRPADLSLIAQTRADLRSGRAREAREAASIRLGEAAQSLGVSHAAVSQWESGRTVPTAAHALAYGKLLRDLARRAA